MPFFEWLEHSRWVLAISESGWMYPAVEILHFFSLFLLVGTIAVIDLRLLGLAGGRQGVGPLAEQLFPWTWIGLGLAVFSGFIMFAASAAEFVLNTQFRIKMLLTVLALVFGIIVQRNAGKWDTRQSGLIVVRLAAFLSLVLWIGVILAATEIANYSAL